MAAQLRIARHGTSIIGNSSFANLYQNAGHEPEITLVKYLVLFCTKTVAPGVEQFYYRYVLF
jgi:hypothetical protein